MTRDEIMAMDAVQLCIAIADLKGLNVKVVEPWTDIYGNVHNSDWCQEERDWIDAGTPIRYDERGLIYRLPDWPTSIADAWELWDELPQPRELFDVPDGDIVCHAGGEHGFMGHYHGWRASGADAPLAISRAWLIWKTETHGDHHGD